MSDLAGHSPHVEPREGDSGWRQLPAGSVFLFVALVQVALAIAINWLWLIPASISVVTAIRDHKRGRR
jgi:hypothetical protein